MDNSFRLWSHQGSCIRPFAPFDWLSQARACGMCRHTRVPCPESKIPTLPLCLCPLAPARPLQSNVIHTSPWMPSLAHAADRECNAFSEATQPILPGQYWNPEPAPLPGSAPLSFWLLGEASFPSSGLHPRGGSR